MSSKYRRVIESDDDSNNEIDNGKSSYATPTPVRVPGTANKDKDDNASDGGDIDASFSSDFEVDPTDDDAEAGASGVALARETNARRVAKPDRLNLKDGPRDRTGERETEIANAEARRQEQLQKNQAIVAQFFDNVIDLNHNSDRIEPRTNKPVELFVKNEISGVDWNHMRTLAKAVLPPPEGRAHASVDIAQVEKTHQGAELLFHMRHILQPLLANGYTVNDAFIKIRQNDADPWHQDRCTGSGSFSRDSNVGFADGTRPGLRVLVNISAYDESEDDTRVMKYGVCSGDGGGEPEVLFETRARFVAMTGDTAGSARTTNVWHARFGSGITFCADLVLPVAGGRVTSGGDAPLQKTLTMTSNTSARDLAIQGWFRKKITEIRQPHNAYGRLNPTLVDEEAADAAARSRADPWPTPHAADSVKHCYRCGVRDAQRYDHVKVDENDVYCYDCYRAFSRRTDRSGGAPISFDRFYHCPAECTGCKYHNLPRHVFTLGGRSNATESKRQRAATHARATASNDPHCYCCQIPILEVKRSNFRSDFKDDNDVAVVGCGACLELWKKRKNNERLAQCPADCKGCRRQAKK